MQNDLNLTPNDYEDLKKLFFITQKIKWAYDNLAVLEINNKKGTQEFVKWTNYLQTLLELEEQIYIIIGKNPKKISDMLCYILDNEPYNITDVLIYLNNDSEEEILKNRVSARFDHLLNTVPFALEEEYFAEEAEEVETDYEDILENVSIEEMEADFFYQAKVDLMMEQDVINTILKMLEDYINNPEFINVKDYLIKFKYKLAFAFKFVEKDFLTNNFTISDTLFWQTKMYTDTKDKSGNQDLKESKNSYAEDLLYEQYGYLLEMFYTDLLKQKNYARAIMTEIFVRTGLILADKEVAGSFILMMESEIDYLEKCDVHNDFAKEFIFKSFSHIEEDKTLPNILSFKI